MTKPKHTNHKQPRFYKLFHWEYWNTWLIYLPLAPFGLWHMFRTRNPFFFERCNPSISFGGMAMAKKSEIYDLIPNQYYPKTILFEYQANSIDSLLDFREIPFPLIVKPDIGLKGLGVAVINDSNELVNYAKNADFDFLIQEKVPYVSEIGIFYCRYPQQKNGFITGIVQKDFAHVIGDGHSSIKQLIEKDARMSFQIQALRELWEDEWQNIPKNGERITLLPIGSHTRGSKFIDTSHKIDQPLMDKIDHIAKQIDGFYFGRFDIMCNSIEDFSHSDKFSIVELNGAMSEPTHMYDPKYSLIHGWKEVLKHWKIMAKIATQNKDWPMNPTPFNIGIQRIKSSIQMEKKFKDALYKRRKSTNI